MSPEAVLNYCFSHFKGIRTIDSWGERSLFYNPEGKLKRGIYILTIKEKDGENDCSSNLDRQGVWRLNIGVRKSTFRTSFGELPARPQKGGVIEMDYDFTTLGCLLPHPVYAWMGWICVLNPTARTFESLKPYVEDAYEYAKEKYAKKAAKM